MASWEDEEFDADSGFDKPVNPVVSDKWEGEDEDEDGLKDNWDDEDEEDDEKPKPVATETKQKKKKTLQDKIKEKEEKKRQEQLEKEEERKRLEAEQAELSPEDQLAEKIKNQRLQEESDLELAREAFGIADVPAAPIPGLKTIDNFTVVDKADFEEFNKMLVKKLSSFESNKDYPNFLENLFRDCCAGLEPDDVKRISSTLTAVAMEKQKALKSQNQKGKKKTAGKTLAKAGKASNKDDFDTYDDYGEFDDFM